MVKVISLLYIFQILYVLHFSRSRYQVSVYRTTGPLVDLCHISSFQKINFFKIYYLFKSFMIYIPNTYLFRILLLNDICVNKIK